MILKCLPKTECLSKMLSFYLFISPLRVTLKVPPPVIIPPDMTALLCWLFVGLLTILAIAAAVDCNYSILNCLADNGINYSFSITVIEDYYKFCLLPA